MWSPLRLIRSQVFFAHFYSSDEHLGSGGCAGDEVQGGPVEVIFSSSIPLKRPTARTKNDSYRTTLDLISCAATASAVLI